MKLVALVNTYNNGSQVKFGNTEEEILEQVRSVGSHGSDVPSYIRIYTTEDGKLVKEGHIDRGGWEYSKGYTYIKIVDKDDTNRVF